MAVWLARLLAVAGVGATAAENDDEREGHNVLDAGDIVPGAMYALLFVVALWRLVVHRPTVCTVSEWPPKFGFHAFVVCFAVRGCLGGVDVIVLTV